MNHRTAFLLILVSACLLLFFPTSASAMLHPTQARFLQRDPKGYPDGMNKYEYVRSSPITEHDAEGLWAGAGHQDITQQTFRKGIPSAAKKGCRNWMLWILAEANLGTDHGEFENKQYVHYNRVPIKGEKIVAETITGVTPAALEAARKKADTDYITWVQDRGRLFEETMVKNKWPGKAQEALVHLGMKEHALQDFFGHAIRRDGAGSALNGGTKGFEAFREKSVTGTPWQRDNFWPSSYVGEHKHYSEGEPVRSEYDLEYEARKDAAIDFMTRESRIRLEQWWNFYGTCCNSDMVKYPAKTVKYTGGSEVQSGDAP